MPENKDFNQIDRFEKFILLRGFSKRTQKSYIYFVKHYLNYANKQQKMLSQKDIEEYVISLLNKGLRPATINLAISAIKTFYRHILKKSCSRIKRIKKQKNFTDSLTQKEVLLLLENARSLKQKMLLELLYSTGLRISECISLKITDINLNNNINKLCCGKGGKDRYFLLSQRARKTIKEYLLKRKRQSNYLFDTKQNHWCARTAQLIIKRLAEKAGIHKRVHPHMLRASFATHSLENGMPLPTLQKLMGHERTETTLGYVKSSKAFLDNVKTPLDILYEKQEKKQS